MYKINKLENSITKLPEKSFKDLKFTERNNLQEWIAKNPSCLGEDLLIIQKEFQDFDGTNERLDLLALDKGGNLVIIENKRDDSGKDVTWQALKYASYCSTFSKSDIEKIYQQYLENENYKKKLCDFFGVDEENYDDIRIENQHQRIILVAANFRKEVTSAVLWLINQGLSIQCFKVTPYEFSQEYFLNVEQIIPIKEAQEYIIKLAKKEQEQNLINSSQKQRHNIRFKFWSKLLNKIKEEKFELFSNTKPSKDNWINTGSGAGFCHYAFVFNKDCARVELYIDSKDKEKNECIFDGFLEYKEKIENQFGKTLIWERLEEKRACRIKYEKEFDSYDEENWDKIIEFMIQNMQKLEKSMKEIIRKINLELK
ncbi:DUF4268 domain-containing protein [Campylobacter sp. RKI_CA19_01128]|uniref:DUF4268 domain-containing protein n=1 Tax=unclassified Campylobacter TaxID=2593542 RepID=UPI0021E803C0|nr:MULTISPECIES: DUF4268 domain-containing protein [unclassified Campylobacter]MCV3348707.1 DUF4268 domain-containing protein [Campylobacter sp. RKI_CA19_01127]MCV3354763.1 DUF4268 domain-containing protein [Campylobacter sp. RKI_CA19_01128]HEC1775992.1 DUF4268 domain-containing protein [Campylobacter lari]